MTEIKQKLDKLIPDYKEIKPYLNDFLEDDETPTGGISFVGERLIDFLLDVGDDHITTLEQVNQALKDCGIKPIKKRETKALVKQEFYQKFYIEVTDERVDLDPPYVWQSEVFDYKELALKLGRKIAQELGRSSLAIVLNSGDYLNPSWEVSCKGIKKFLHVDLMVMNFYNEDEYDIDLEERIK